MAVRAQQPASSTSLLCFALPCFALPCFALLCFAAFLGENSYGLAKSAWSNRRLFCFNSITQNTTLYHKYGNVGDDEDDFITKCCLVGDEYNFTGEGRREEVEWTR